MSAMISFGGSPQGLSFVMMTMSACGSSDNLFRQNQQRHDKHISMQQHPNLRSVSLGKETFQVSSASSTNGLLHSSRRMHDRCYVVQSWTFCAVPTKGLLRAMI